MQNNSDALQFESILERIRAKLPIQNPLHSFVHNNILMMFEGKEFHEALAEAGQLYRARSYWNLERYKSKFEEKKYPKKIFGMELINTHFIIIKLKRPIS